ncbi:MAG TPA: hypothetical protein VMU15_19130, partial [Anaeromyxobacter sp.]|nr:hypothetical protein [Anaeromyxobacter sp.]
LTRKPATAFQGYLDSALMTLFVAGVVLVLVNAAVRCVRTARGEAPPHEAFGPPTSAEGVPLRCC